MSPEDREALKWAITAIRDDRDHPRDGYSQAAIQLWLQEERWERAIAAVQRILDNATPNEAPKEPTIVAVFTEQCFEEIYRSSSREEAHAFASGVVTGANCYGAGSCMAYVLPDEEADMHEHEDDDEIAKVLERVARLGPIVKPKKCASAVDPESTGTCARCGFATEDH